MDPFHQMESHTVVLSRLHDTSDLLRRISRHQQLTKKLQSCQDPIIVAAILNEISKLHTLFFILYFILLLFFY